MLIDPSDWPHVELMVFALMDNAVGWEIDALETDEHPLASVTNRL
jgi:hypothetical protein